MNKTRAKDHDVQVDLIAVLAAVINGAPSVLTIGQGDKLPSGPFELGHRSMQAGLRMWVERQTGHPLGYIEQLYTFADRDRIESETGRAISISYLGLTRAEVTPQAQSTSHWIGWYDYFPWEDHRQGAPSLLTDVIGPRLREWADESPQDREERRQRVARVFGFDGEAWNEDLTLQRYELLFEAGMVAEAHRGSNSELLPDCATGKPMFADHRRILATAIARLRTKIKYRPMVFEMMPPVFTLLQLQRAVEALSGRLIHKQNFRRLIEQQELVEETGDTTAETGGRPAKLFRFRQSVHMERNLMGTRLPTMRT